MFSEQSNCFSMRHLMTVFRLCDPEKTGRIRIKYLQELALIYAPEQLQEINGVLNEMDSVGQGTLSFREFCTGVRTIRRRQKLHARFKDPSSMGPTILAGPPESSSTPQNGRLLSAGPEPTFLINPPSPSNNNINNNSGNVNTVDSGSSKSQCSSLSDGENYEWNGIGVAGGDSRGGEVGVNDIDADSGISSGGDRNLGDGTRTHSPLSGINRHTWLRTSLRRSSPNHQDNLPNRRWGSFRHSNNNNNNNTAKRQLGSNALASQLYRSSSFNSSGRSSSTCDTADDMYSDASLEEDVNELHHKFQVLTQQVGVLQDSANQNDERYTRAKAENASLQARVIMLEEQLRDTEIRYDERLQDEQRRSRELLQRLEREKQLQLENASIRLQAAETEAANLKEEVVRQRNRIEKLENERRELSDQMQDLTNEVIVAKEQANSFKEKERRLNQEHEAQVHLIEELSKELEKLRSEARTPALPTTSLEMIRLEELHEEINNLRTRNSQLQETNDELQASLLHAGLEQGRKLTAGENSLAAELEAMTQDEPVMPHDPDSLVKMQQALKEQQEVNLQLRCYIDGILLNIVENYPQLLEVKQKSV